MKEKRTNERTGLIENNNINKDKIAKIRCI